ncbi:MAG: UDP-3-O-(3-hydroxymyristoyl)glucosamine N-acyltransferase, partial [Planctomycetes bacterium]|nr:UDP-3-O-(3-hydroxymyristoyl)glucosamine N-acyltransferase [Planctomycetota bacterium]
MSTLKELAIIAGGELIGDARLDITGISEIQNGMPGTITFLGNPRYKKYLSGTKASAVLTDDRALLAGRNGIVVSNTQLALARLLEYFKPVLTSTSGIHPTAVIDSTAEIGSNVSIGPHAIIEAGVQIGQNSTIEAQVIIGQNSRIGQDCIIYP